MGSNIMPVASLFTYPRVFLDYGNNVSSKFATVLERIFKSSVYGFPKPNSLEKALLMIDRFLCLFGD